jgi:hypothetical protein
VCQVPANHPSRVQVDVGAIEYLLVAFFERCDPLADRLLKFLEEELESGPFSTFCKDEALVQPQLRSLGSF